MKGIGTFVAILLVSLGVATYFVELGLGVTS